MEEDFLLDAEDDARAVEFIQNYLPQEIFFHSHNYFKKGKSYV